MITNRKVRLLAFLAFVLIIALTSCSDANGGASNAEVRVVGTAEASEARALSGSAKFASGNVYLNSEDITSRLKPADASVMSGNDVEFEADVTVPSQIVTYSVSPKRGFVFDEWEITRSSFRELRNNPEWRNILKEIQEAISKDGQEIAINAEYIRYIRPTFERGVYYLHGHKNGDGTADNPYGSIEEVKEFIQSYGRDYDDDELTIKMRGGNADSFDISGLSFFGNDVDEIELKIIGGYDSSWNLSEEKTVFSGITFPSFGAVEEIELELRNIMIESFDYSEIAEDLEIDFKNCAVGTLKGASGKVLNAIAVENAEGSSITFVNSVAPYAKGNTYFHSLVKTASQADDVEGKNNIIIGSAAALDTDNLYLESWSESGYMTDDPDLIVQIINASPLHEDMVINGMDDDILEEDIEGRERYLIEDGERPSERDIKVSYGPYEYQYFDD